MVERTLVAHSPRIVLHDGGDMTGSKLIIGNLPPRMAIVCFESIEEGRLMYGRAKEIYPSLKLVGFSAWLHEAEAFELIHNYNCLLQNIDSDHLLKALIQLTRNNFYFTQRNYFLLLHPDCTFQAPKHPIEHLLAKMPFACKELLRLLCQHPDWTDKRLAETTYKTESTVSKQIHHACELLHLNGKKELIELLNGYYVEELVV
jgi:DNA-binding CsgD family transcriptional regulator